MTMTPAGYIIACGSAIYGAGDTLEAAAADAVQWIDGMDSANELLTEIERNKELERGSDKAYAMQATQALIDHFRESGVVHSWGELEGIACSAEEAST
ncbi:hypothetical protein [Phytohalomonas tamaricis]|uniref:hypothetical protein n=1 Tax=Phytohalomonas tamaricis TaxID=2081032 RepID=UPI000D0B5364|nr:hypothetical protein [Phytohalomonas tamaricis]